MMPHKTSLASFLLQIKPPSHQEHINAFASISRYNLASLNILKDDSTREFAILHADRVLPRLQRLFESIKSTDVATDISERLLQGLVLPFFQGNDQLITSDQAFSLVGSALPIITNVSSRSSRQMLRHCSSSMAFWNDYCQ